MTRPIRRTLSPQALDRNGICAAQSPTGASTLTLNGALVSGGLVTFTTPQHVTVYAPGNEATDTFTITGTDRNGLALTETITGVATGTVAGTKNFLTVTSVATDAAGTNIEVGVDGTCESAWWPLDTRNWHSDVNVGAVMGGGGTPAMTYSLQTTFDDVQASTFTESGASTFTDATMSGETASSTTALTAPTVAIRAAITAHTSGTLTMTIVQDGE